MIFSALSVNIEIYSAFSVGILIHSAFSGRAETRKIELEDITFDFQVSRRAGHCSRLGWLFFGHDTVFRCCIFFGGGRSQNVLCEPIRMVTNQMRLPCSTSWFAFLLSKTSVWLCCSESRCGLWLWLNFMIWWYMARDEARARLLRHLLYKINKKSRSVVAALSLGRNPKRSIGIEIARALH